MAIILDNHVVLLTGANRGIGLALLKAFLAHPVQKIYAVARNPGSIPDMHDNRVIPLQHDLLDTENVAQIAEVVSDVSLLVNNAGIADFGGIANGSTEAIRQNMELNYFGTLALTQALIPHLKQRDQAGIVNLLTIVAYASMAALGGYSASKAALWSATQSLRAELSGEGVSVYGVYPGPIDTDMIKDIAMPKTSASSAAEAILVGLQSDQLDIYPDAMSLEMSRIWLENPKKLEEQFAQM